MSASQLSIAITTRNRWAALRATLAVLAQRLPDIDVDLVDDGSDTPAPYDPRALHPRLRFTAERRPAGLIARRNALLEQARTPFVLSLDDDAYPVHGELSGAVEVLASAPQVLCVSLPVFNPTRDAYQNPPRPRQAPDCQAFFGCAHVMRREAFLALGGYNAALVHQGEERDLAARGFKRGLRCVHFAGALVHHLESNEGRDWTRMDYYGARNAVLWNDWYVPDGAQPSRAARRLLATLAHAVTTRRPGQLHGHLAAARERRALRRFRDRFTPAQFAHWRALPYA